MQIYSNPWHIISALLIFILGILITIKIKNKLNLKSSISILLYLWHTFFCLFYLWYSLSNSADSTRYYSKALAGNITFELGTAGIDYFTALLVQGLGLSYLGCFLIYNLIGSIGLLYFYKTLTLATLNSPKKIKYLTTIIIFLPSISFWSSAIGKDAISFLSVCLALWAALELNRRNFLMLTSISLMLLVRPHMAGLMVIGLSISSFVEPKSSITKKILMGSFSIIIAATLIPYALDYSGIKDEITSDTLMNYIESRQGSNLEGGSSVDIASMSLPMQLFTYLFRPVLFEARSIFSLFAAIDNFILLYLFIAGGYSFFKNKKIIIKGNENRIFMWTYSILSWLVLSMTTANLGIALRQKWMFVPVLIFLLISLTQKKQLTNNLKSI